jgi:hypothetical protein
VQKFHGGVEFEPHLHAGSAVARRGASRLVAKAAASGMARRLLLLLQ